MIDRYVGCLLGLACGDALGGPVEFQSREQVRQRFPTGLREFVGGGWLSLAPGEITDDTQMTLAIAESLALGGALNMDDVSARFIAWYRSQPKDIGNTTRAAIELLIQEIPWESAGERVHRESRGRAAGNGSIMRCAPVALRFANSPDQMVQASIDTSRITHADERCTSSAVAMNQAIVSLLAGGDLSGVVNAALNNVENEDVRLAMQRAQSLDEKAVPNGGFVLDTLTAASWALLNNSSLEETIVAAVSLGGDADTTGAVAGALAGAYYGAQAIPLRWLGQLHQKEKLELLAHRLLELSAGTA